MTVWLCSGQGAQRPGMGADLLACDEFEQVKDVFAIASSVLDIDLAELACNGNEEQINDPFAAQALTVAISVGVGHELAARGHRPEAIVGFSLGQVSALALSGMLSVKNTFTLLKARATGIAAACAKQDGAMAALMGASHEDAAELCASCAQGDILLPANYNCPGQVVISGNTAAIERAQAVWAAEHGERKVARLNTAGAFHTPLMASAAAATGKAARDLTFAEPACPVLCNTDSEPLCAAQAAERMERQVTSPVRFEQSIAKLIAGGATEFAELGYGSVLANLVKRCDRKTTRHALGSADALKTYLGIAE